MATFELPALKFTCTAGGPGKAIPLSTGSACSITAFPVVNKNLVIVTQKKNQFVLPKTSVELLTSATSVESQLQPGLSLRFTQLGNGPSDHEGLTTTPRVHQHVLTEHIGLQNLLQCLQTGAEFSTCHETQEDNMTYKIGCALHEPTPAAMSLCARTLEKLRVHTSTLENAHGAQLLSAENLVSIAERGRHQRQAKIEALTATCFQNEGPVEWNLRATRAVKGLNIDMQMSDQIRQGGMQANLAACTQTLALNLGGMLANITQRFNGNLSSESSTVNALNLWNQATNSSQKVAEYRNAVAQGTIFTSAYVADPAFVATGDRLTVDLTTAGEDQMMVSGLPSEAILNQSQSGATGLLGDCEDTAAQNATQIDLMQLPRQTLASELKTAIDNMPKQFSTSSAASDYKLHQPQLVSLAMMINSAYQVPEAVILPSVKTKEQMVAHMTAGLKQSNASNILATTGALVASAPKLECAIKTQANLAMPVASVEQYTKNWKTNMNSQWMGHSACIELETQPLCEYNGVVISCVKNLNVMEGTSCASKLRGVNQTLHMDLLAHRQNELRTSVQTQLNSIGQPLSTVMAINLGATVLATEMRTALHTEGNQMNVNASQVYTLNGIPTNQCIDGTFYRTLVNAGKMECATLDLNTMRMFPGIAMDIAPLPNTLNIALQAKMSKEEANACNLLGHLVATQRLSAPLQAQVSATLSPLNLRQQLHTVASTTPGQAPVTLQAQSTLDVMTSTDTMGSMVKCVNASINTLSEQGLQLHAQNVSKTAAAVYGIKTSVQFGPFVNAMLVSTPADC